MNKFQAPFLLENLQNAAFAAYPARLTAGYYLQTPSNKLRNAESWLIWKMRIFSLLTGFPSARRS